MFWARFVLCAGLPGLPSPWLRATKPPDDGCWIDTLEYIYVLLFGLPTGRQHVLGTLYFSGEAPPLLVDHFGLLKCTLLVSACNWGSGPLRGKFGLHSCLSRVHAPCPRRTALGERWQASVFVFGADRRAGTDGTGPPASSQRRPRHHRRDVRRRGLCGRRSCG